MPKYAIAFISNASKKPLYHHITESADKDSALRLFFNKFMTDYYSTDEQGYYYFKEDFYDDETGIGSIIQCE
jgi:hypothetical protein